LNGISAGFVAMAYAGWESGGKGSVDDFVWDEDGQIVVEEE
jgi:hypothetical protein